MKPARLLLVVSLVLLLAGCKTDLYTKLNEAEANQMMSLLLANHIAVEKLSSKEGVSLRVDEDRFVNATEILRQNGFPRSKKATIEDLFPSGQLVTSPEQEAAKLLYVKGMQVEQMLSSMDGVITAEVSVAEQQTQDDMGPVPASAAVFIKYSPTANLSAREAEIRALVSDGIPGLKPERVSVVLQRAVLHFQDPPAATAPSRWPFWLAAGGSITLFLFLATTGLLIYRKELA